MTQNFTKGEVRAVVRDVNVDWHPARQAAVVTLATTEELPPKIKEYAA